MASQGFLTVARIGEIAEGRGRAFEVEGRTIAVFLDEGEYFAIDDACPHRGVPLCDGIVYDRSVTCTWHGWRFSLVDGRHLNGLRARVGTYPVRVFGGEIQVSVSRPLAADGPGRSESLPKEPSLMRAAFIEQTGPPEAIKVGELPRPTPGPGQVLVKVGAAALNPIDLYVRSGQVAMPMSFPYIIGSDVAGTVEHADPGSKRLRAGDRVWGSNQGLLGRQGVAAEYAAIDEEWLYLTPPRLSDVEAASLALVGITAHLGLFQHARLSAGETLYVPGGSGGVGSMVVQMAKAIGARVATSAGSPDRVEFCKSIGADLALNYKTDDIPARLRELSPEGIDVWYETRRDPDLEVSVPLLRKRGRMVVIAGRAARPVLPLGSFYPRDCSLLGFAMFNATADEQARSADDIGRWVVAGQLKPHVGKVFPLEEAAQAEKFLEENAVAGAGTNSGKVVIQVA